jgi:hypothetical protein
MRVNVLTGIKTLVGFGRQIGDSVAAQPDGLLLHEPYSIRGGFESVYVDVQKPIGFLRFAIPMPAKGGLFSARDRLRRSGAPETPAPYTDSEQ